MKILAVIPARCGSKGFVDKNIAKVQGKTLLELAVGIGLNCKIIDDVYISTDCRKYEEIAIAAGAQSLGLRKEALAGDNVKSIDVLIDLLESIGKKYDYIVLLQPTSPVRTINDIENALNQLIIKDADASVSICKFEEPHPFKLKSVNSNGYVESFLNNTTSEVTRQSLPEVYALNGAIYVIKSETILSEKTFFPEKTIPYMMDSNINIDCEADYILLKALIDDGLVIL
jgi:CMP-N,N'-diacetyllegionaminic acid synthase